MTIQEKLEEVKAKVLLIETEVAKGDDTDKEVCMVAIKEIKQLSRGTQKLIRKIDKK